MSLSNEKYIIQLVITILYNVLIARTKTIGLNVGFKYNTKIPFIEYATSTLNKWPNQLYKLVVFTIFKQNYYNNYITTDSQQLFITENEKDITEMKSLILLSLF